jgi:hypothetical protein
LLGSKPGTSEEVGFNVVIDAEAETGLFSGRTSSEELLLFWKKSKVAPAVLGRAHD